MLRNNRNARKVTYNKFVHHGSSKAKLILNPLTQLFVLVTLKSLVVVVESSGLSVGSLGLPSFPLVVTSRLAAYTKMYMIISNSTIAMSIFAPAPVWAFLLLNTIFFITAAACHPVCVPLPVRRYTTRAIAAIMMMKNGKMPIRSR